MRLKSRMTGGCAERRGHEANNAVASFWPDRARRYLALNALLGFWIGVLSAHNAHAFPPADPAVGAAPEHSLALTPSVSIERARLRLAVRYSPLAGFRVFPTAAAAQGAQPVDLNFVALRIYDPLNNWLRIQNEPGTAGTHTPGDANQVFSSVFDSTTNAIHVACLAGCAASFGADIAALDASHQKVVGWNGISLSSAKPGNGQIYAYDSKSNQWVPGDVNSQLPAGGPNQFMGWDGTQWSAIQPSFSNLSGLVTDLQLSGAYSGLGACPPNQFANALVRNGAPQCAAAVAVTAAPSNQFATGISAGGGLAYAQPLFANLGGAATPGQLPGANSAAQGAVVLTKDLGGTSSLPLVTGLQGNPVQLGTPSLNQILTWNGNAWAATTAPPTGAQIARDLGGTPSLPLVTGLQGNPVQLGTPAPNQILTWNGTTWAGTNAPLTGAQIAQDLGGTSLLPLVTGLQGNPVQSGTPAPNQILTWNGTAWAGTNAPLTGAQIAQDLGGTSSLPLVTGLQGNPVQSGTPALNQILAWTGAAWAATNGPPTGAQIALDLGGTLSLPKVVGLQGRSISSTAPGANQFLGWSTGATQWQPAQVSFGNLTGVIAAGQTPLTTNGDLLTMAGGSLARLAIGGANQCLQVNGAGTGYLFGSCAATPGGSNAQLQFNNSGSFGGAANFTYNTASGAVAVQPAPSQDAVALTLSPSISNPTQDVFDIFKDSGRTTKALWVDAAGNLNFGGNSATYGAPAQGTQSWLRLYGSTVGSSLAPPYFDLEKTDGSVRSFLAPSTSISGTLCVGSSVPGSDCAAGSTLLTNPMTNTGDLVTGGAANALGIAAPARLALGAVGQCLQVLAGPALGYGSCASGGAGTVTSVGLSLPSIFTVSGTPVTSTGSLTGTLAAQSANLVWAGPSSGGALAPAFRSLVKADQVPTTAYTDQGNTWTAGVQDMSGAAAYRVPVAAGLTATVNGQIGYDSTLNVPHMAVNSADAKLATFTATPVAGNCVRWISATQIGDQGSACGSGGGGSSAWSSLTSPTSSESLSMAGFSTTFSQSAAVTGTANSFAFVGNSGSTSTGAQVLINGGGASDTQPLLGLIGTNTAVVPATINAVLGQTADLLDLSVNGARKSYFLNSGALVLGGGLTFSTSSTIGGSFASANLTFTCGSNSTNNSSCVNTVQGADITGGAAANATAGSVYGRGGNTADSAASTKGGSYEIGAGQATANGSAQPGLIVQYASYSKGTSVGQWNLQCIQAAMQVQDCGASAANWLGVAEIVGTNSITVLIPSGQGPVNSSNSAAVGDTVCIGAAAPKVTDSGGAAACANGLGVGVVIAVAGTWGLPDGTSFTASSSLPLVQFRPH